MEKTVRRIDVFASRGGTPSMNAVIRTVVRVSLHMGIECVGIRRGYHGLTDGDFIKLTFESVNGLSRRGGTMLYPTCSGEFKTPAGQERAVTTCKMSGLDVLAGISGDDTFSGLLYLAKRGSPIVGIPGTIDNDTARSSYTIGYDTACNAALESIDKLRGIIQSHECCSVVEIMGHRAGHLALTVGVVYGAIAVTVPGHPVDYEAGLLKPIRRTCLAGRTHFMTIVTEGVEGGACPIGKVTERTTALDTQVIALGRVQWGGSLSFRDWITTTYMGYEVVCPPAGGKTCRATALQGENYVDYDTTEAPRVTKSLDQHTYEVMRALVGVY